jgi:hypothetical protein
VSNSVNCPTPRMNQSLVTGVVPGLVRCPFPDTVNSCAQWLTGAPFRPFQGNVDHAVVLRSPWSQRSQNDSSLFVPVEVERRRRQRR